MEQKGREGKKDFKKGEISGQGVGALKRGDWNPLTNYVSLQPYGNIIHFFIICLGENHVLLRSLCWKKLSPKVSIIRSQSHIIRSPKQCQLFNTIACYASRTTGTYGRFCCLTIFQFVQ